MRALWINLRGGETLSGGSTITQQVARNLLMNQDERIERTLRRKLREAMLAWQITQKLSKAEILALYLNQINYGGMAYGVEAASQTYFGKPLANYSCLNAPDCRAAQAPESIIHLQIQTWQSRDKSLCLD